MKCQVTFLLFFLFLDFHTWCIIRYLHQCSSLFLRKPGICGHPGYWPLPFLQTLLSVLLHSVLLERHKFTREVECGTKLRKSIFLKFTFFLSQTPRDLCPFPWLHTVGFSPELPHLGINFIIDPQILGSDWHIANVLVITSYMYNLIFIVWTGNEPPWDFCCCLLWVNFGYWPLRSSKKNIWVIQPVQWCKH